MTYQVISRNNDISGNPFRLITVFDSEGILTELYEARSSSPNIVSELNKKGYKSLPSYHVTPKDYNERKSYYSQQVKLNLSH